MEMNNVYKINGHSIAMSTIYVHWKLLLFTYPSLFLLHYKAIREDKKALKSFFWLSLCHVQDKVNQIHWHA